MGGILEARFRDILLRHSWVLAIIAGVPAVFMFRQGHVVPGILLLLGAVPFFLPVIPPVMDFVTFLAVSPQFNIHLRSHIHEIRRMQKGSMPDEVEEGLQNQGSWQDKLSSEEKRKLEEVNQRFTLEAMLRRAESHTRVDELIDDASTWSASGSTFAPDAGMARAMEFIVLAIIILSASYVFLGFREAMDIKADWSTPLLYGAIAAIFILLVIHIVQFVLRQRSRRRLERAELPCLMCGTKTRQRVDWGALRPHLCTEKCEQELIQFFGRIRQAKSSPD
jgi:ABC-type multidrug transport system fused ATPase/permease subunit